MVKTLPPGRVRASRMVTSCPACVNSYAADSPANPAPTITTRLGVPRRCSWPGDQLASQMLGKNAAAVASPEYRRNARRVIGGYMNTSYVRLLVSGIRLRAVFRLVGLRGALHRSEKSNRESTNLGRGQIGHILLPAVILEGSAFSFRVRTNLTSKADPSRMTAPTTFNHPTTLNSQLNTLNDHQDTYRS